MTHYYRYLTAGDTATKALLDDREPLSVIRTGNQTVNNSTTFVNDDTLTLALAASSTYHVSLVVNVSGPSAADWKQQWTAPAGATGTRFTHGPSTGASSVRANNVNFRSAPLTTSLSYNTDGTEISAIREEIWMTTTNAGNLTLTWAQLVATVGSTTVWSGSYMSAYRVV
ncbi:hypothetical protein [Glycomyces sp. NPDC048151]|uniref:hypothetical protein n=1 Tax=Glycomyces sp. NPDC048151 TaxID=3364002 RepID=UPI003711B4CD